MIERPQIPSSLVGEAIPISSEHGQLASPWRKEGPTKSRTPAATLALKQRPFLPSLVQEHITVLAAPTFLVLMLVTVYVHELAHVVVAVLLGIPILEFRWLEPARLAPVMYTPNIESPWVVSLLGVVGGLVTGGLWLLVYLEFFIHRKLNERGPGWWLTGLLIAILAAWQLGQGLIEGGFPEAYFVGAVDLANFGTLMPISVITMGAAIHLAHTQLWRRPWLESPVIGVDRRMVGSLTAFGQLHPLLPDPIAPPSLSQLFAKYLPSSAVSSDTVLNRHKLFPVRMNHK